MEKKYLLAAAALLFPVIMIAAAQDMSVLKGEIEDSVAKQIKKYSPSMAVITVSVVGIESVSVLNGADNITAETGDEVRSVMKARVSGTKGGKTVAAAVMVKVESVCPVLAASRTIPSGALISKQDLIFMNRNIAALNFTPFVDDAGLAAGKRAARAIQSGKIISPADLEDVPAVVPGQHVTIICTDDMMKLETQGRAEEKGSVGDMIKVTNIASKKVIFARVLPGGSVEAGGER
jgi:flagella basal body P-ring formation protein FlgA